MGLNWIANTSLYRLNFELLRHFKAPPLALDRLYLVSNCHIPCLKLSWLGHMLHYLIHIHLVHHRPTPPLDAPVRLELNVIKNTPPVLEVMVVFLFVIL